MRPLDVLAGVVVLCHSALGADDPVPQFYNSARRSAADPYTFYDSATGLYHVYSTEGAEAGSLFGVYSSPDLATWHQHPGGALKACYDADGNPVEGGQACWARDWQWAPEAYHNEKTGWYFFFFAGRLLQNMTAEYFRYSAFEEPSKIGVAVSRTPQGPFTEIEGKPIDYFPFDPNYHDVNLIMDDLQLLPPQSEATGETAPKGTYIPTIDPNVFFSEDGRIFLYTSRNAYRNWNWDDVLGKYIEESNIIVVELERDWWDDPTASTMPQIAASEVNVNAKHAPKVPCNITSYNGTGEIGHPPRMDGWKTIISYGADPQSWENAHVDDYQKSNGTLKDRRWAEGSSLITRPNSESYGSGKPAYLLTYSANNYDSPDYGVGFATADSPLGPFRKSSNNPVLSQQPNATIPIYSTGHGSFVASPPRGLGAAVGAQEVTHRTPGGSELFYVHHARNSTTADRSIYTTRITLDEDDFFFGANGTLSMHLTSLDQPLPQHTYPIKMDVQCVKTAKSGHEFDVRVLSRPGAPFDLTEGADRVVSLPGNKVATSVKHGKPEGVFKLSFGDATVRELAYQRLNVDGTWSTDATKQVSCK